MSNKFNGIGAKGYYIALILCAAAIGITGYVYYHNQNAVQEAISREVIPETQAVQPTQAAKKDTAKPSTRTAKPASSAPTTAPAATAATEPPVRKTLQTAAPVSGEVITDYSMECLSYNETTRDWRVHNGVDLAAPAGSPVLAAAEGTVYTTYEDDTLGYTVVLRHEGGYTTRYSNLTDTLCVSAGDKVGLGDTLGYVGCSALVETATDSHVHFSVSYQDMPMSPQDFLNLQ